MADHVIKRTGARIILLAQEKILLAHQHDPARPERPGYWVVPGGGVDAGESLASAAIREVFEETGLRIDPDALGPVVAHDEATFDFEGRRYRQSNVFFCVEAPLQAATFAGWTELEQRAMTDVVWHDIAALGALREPLFPASLPDALPRLRASAGGAPIWLGGA